MVHTCRCSGHISAKATPFSKEIAALGRETFQNQLLQHMSQALHAALRLHQGIDILRLLHAVPYPLHTTCSYWLLR